MTRQKTKTARLAPGTQLGSRYQIRAYLGAGGFASVYAATDTVLDRSVAIKVLACDEEDVEGNADFVARFEREAKMAGRVDHVNVVSIYDYSVHEGQPFIVMECLDGHDLQKELIQNGPMAPERLWPLIGKCLDALARGHHLGIVHKDLKPSNLFLTHPGTDHEDVRVLDFGIARSSGADSSLTGTGQVFGTVQYLAPEYIKDKNNVTPALDVYQMGLILVEALSGQPPVDADGLACAYKHVTGELIIPAPLLDSPLGAVIGKALALEPEDRYPTTTAFREALDAVDPSDVPRLSPNDGKRSLRDVSKGHRGLAVPSEGPQTGPTSVVRITPEMAGSKPAAKPTQTAEVAPRGSGHKPLMLIALVSAVVCVAALVTGGVFAAELLADADPSAADDVAEVATSERAATPASAAVAPAVPEVADPVPEEPTPAVDPPAAAPTADDKAPAAGPIRVTVASSPAGATVFDGRTKLGKTPMTVEFASDKTAARTLRIARAGYQPTTARVAPGDGPEKVVSLTRKAKPKAKATKKKSGGGGYSLIPK